MAAKARRKPRKRFLPTEVSEERQRPIYGQPKTQLWWCNLIHIFNDGYITALALLLPFIAADLGLNYTQSGFLKSAISGAISVAQIPAGLLSERIGEILILGLGTAWFSLSYIAMFLASSYALLLLLILSAGFGGGVYHPVGTALISNVFPPAKTGPAIGTLNFFGDVGKVLFPALTGLLVAALGWQGSLVVLGGIGLVVSVLYLWFFRREIGLRRRQIARTKQESTTGKGWGIRKPVQFTLYAVIGFLDTGIRSAVTAFLGFMLIKTGVEEGNLGWLISLTFLGGAMGKLLCGMPIRRFGEKKIILFTEVLMILGCWALPSIPPGWVLLLFLPLFGFMLNGTSSVIYIGLAPTFEADYRSRGYALYFTLSFFASAAAPALFGLVGDAFGLRTVFYVAGATMLLGLPLVMFLRDD